MSITVEYLTNSNESEWEDFVAKPDNIAGIWHSLKWKKIVEHEYGYKPFYLSARKDGKICGILPLFQIKSLLTGNRLVSLPFSYYCGIAANSDEAKEQLIRKATELVQELECSYLELKMQKPIFTNLPFDMNLVESDYYFTSIVPLSSDPADNWKKLDTRRTRWAVNKAKKLGVIIRTETNINDIEKFYDLKVQTRKKHGAPAPSLKFFKNIMEEFKREDIVKLWVAEHENKIISALIFYTFKDTVMPAYIASDEKYNSYMPSNLLYWNAIEWGCNNGYKYFDFGRTEPNNEDLLKFKTKWGTDNYKIPYYYYPVVPNLMSKNRNSAKASLITGLYKKLPVPILKILGPKLIKHLG